MQQKAEFRIGVAGTPNPQLSARVPTSPRVNSYRRVISRVPVVRVRVEAKDLLIAIHGASSTLPVAATVNVDEGMTWTDHFADFVDPRPRELLNGSIRDVDSAEALSELWRDADGESWYE